MSAAEKSATARWGAVFVVLLGLTAASYAVANSALMDGDSWRGPALMLVISAAKASLVGLFFMHLWWERAWKFWVTIPAILMAIILVVALYPDVGNRRERFSSLRSRYVADTPVLELQKSSVSEN